MAILETAEGAIEVRIHKDPLTEEADYYTEHVKLSDREQKDAINTDRYIPCREDEKYGIEIRLKEGFDFGDYTIARARFQTAGSKTVIKAIDYPRPADHEGGIKEDLIFYIRTASARVDGQTIRDAHFAFKGLAVEDQQSQPEEEVDANRIDPNICASLKITVFLCGWTRRARTEAEMNARKAAREKRNKEVRPNKAERRGRPKKEGSERQNDMAGGGKINEEIYKKEGLGFTIGFVGGTIVPKRATKARVREAEPIRDYVQTRSESAPVVFIFQIRTAEFLSSNPLYATYPPLLEFHPWETLSVPEQKIALKSLQEYHQLYTHRDREKRAGQILPRNFQFKDFRLDDPREWRPWDKLSQAERRPAFVTLQKFKRALERSMVLQAVGEADPNEFIDLRQFANPVRHSEVEFVDPAGRGISASRSRRRSASTAGLLVQDKVKSEPTDPRVMLPVEETGQAQIEALDRASVEHYTKPLVKASLRTSVEPHIQQTIEEVTGVTDMACAGHDESESNLQSLGKTKAKPDEAASVKEERDEQSPPLRKKAKSENGFPRTPTSLITQNLPVNINIAEENILKLEEDARDLDKEIQEAEHLAVLRRKRAAVKAKLEAVTAQSRRSTSSFPSPSGSIA